MSYATYEFYLSTFYGSVIPSADFMSYASRASDFIDYYTGNKAKTSTCTEAIGKATCAVAEAYYKADRMGEGNSNLKSETVGSWSATYASGTERQQALKNEVTNAARQYLAFTGLLYRGV